MCKSISDQDILIMLVDMPFKYDKMHSCSVADISIECFTKSRKGRDIMPLQSQKGYELIYKGNTIYKPPPPVSNTRRPKPNNPTGNDSKPGNSQRISTSVRAMSFWRSYSLSAVKDSKSDIRDRLDRPKLERPTIQGSTATNATSILTRSAVCQSSSYVRNEDIVAQRQCSPYAVRQPPVPPIKMFNNIPPFIKITKTLQGLRHSKKEPNRGR